MTLPFRLTLTVAPVAALSVTFVFLAGWFPDSMHANLVRGLGFGILAGITAAVTVLWFRFAQHRTQHQQALDDLRQEHGRKLAELQRSIDDALQDLRDMLRDQGVDQTIAAVQELIRDEVIVPAQHADEPRVRLLVHPGTRKDGRNRPGRAGPRGIHQGSVDEPREASGWDG